MNISPGDNRKWEDGKWVRKWRKVNPGKERDKGRCKFMDALKIILYKNR